MQKEKYLIKFINKNVGDRKTEFFKCENIKEIINCIDLFIDTVNWCISDNDLIYKNDDIKQMIDTENITINHIERLINNNNRKLLLFKNITNFDKCIFCRVENCI